MSMAVDDREAVKQSITSTVVEEPVQKESTARKLLTLVIIHSDGKVLLGLKKRGFGKGYYNGFGGKVEKGETIDQAAARELQEESGVTATDMEKRGILTFHFDNDPLAWEVHVYYATKFLGEPCETDEMAPTWFSVADIPYGSTLVHILMTLPSQFMHHNTAAAVLGFYPPPNSLAWLLRSFGNMLNEYLSIATNT
ncbi:hypothetical protein AXG93_4022s1250 [Marchantia polymorpha subsp. ruderalis]|uniref:Oxidized purine nucleoside triphosphate hydrolase n=1 Tax=Marchantia polymorpha subsp. ruderalis TaxID=1480154 RepID=A0A176W0Z9_MARPO|nr:hypothetical protein AXG93_4022s1250 [Marchantia polymorpha subsp. ruderalis]